MKENKVENLRIINVDIEKEMQKSFLDYSMSVIVARALPDVRERLSRWEEVLEIQSDGFSNLTRGIESFLS